MGARKGGMRSLICREKNDQSGGAPLGVRAGHGAIVGPNGKLKLESPQNPKLPLVQKGKYRSSADTKKCTWELRSGNYLILEGSERRDGSEVTYYILQSISSPLNKTKRGLKAM